LKPEGIFTFLLVLCSNGKDSSPFSSSSRSSSRRTKSRWEPVAKSRWEPVAEENVANNVELPNELAKINICSSLEPTKRMVNLWVGSHFFHPFHFGNCNFEYSHHPKLVFMPEFISGE
jgi:hypothetical protein